MILGDDSWKFPEILEDSWGRFLQTLRDSCRFLEILADSFGILLGFF